MLMASGYAFAPALVGQALGTGDAGSGEGAQSWTIGNELIKRVLTYQPTTGSSHYAGLYTSQFSGLATNADFISSQNLHQGFAQEFVFRCNEQICTGTNATLNFVSADEKAFPNGRSLTIRLRYVQLPLEVDVVYSVYTGHPVIRKHLVFRNTGATALHLSHLNIEALGIALGPASQITLLTQYGAVPREIFYTGRSEDAALLIANGRTGNGLAIISEVPGYMKRTEVAGWDDADHVKIGALYDTDIMPFERALAGGEEFTTASVSLIAFRNGDGFNDPHWALPSYSAQVLMRRVDRQGAPWIYNTWEPFQRTINHDVALELIDIASVMGMDIFTIDDGWQQEYGDNIVNLNSFPGGLLPIVDALAAKGMKLGLWIPIASVGSTTPAYREHPEWAALDQEGKSKITGTAAGPKAVMCMASGYRDSAAARIIDAIDRFHLGYVKLDLTTVFNAYGEAPGCWAKGHYHGNWAESLNLIYEGVSYVTRKIYEKHPDVLLDLTFELWGQKHIIDAGLLAAGDLDWLSNVDDDFAHSAGPLQARQLLYSRAASMPAECMLIGNIHAEGTPIEERFATAIGSAPLFLGDLRKLTSADRQWYHEKIAWFKNLRHTTRISESFFPLGSSLQTTSTAWDGFARLARSGNGVVALFRNQAPDQHATVKLPVLPVGKYKVRSVLTGNDIGMFTNADFARGVSIKFADGKPVEVLEISSVRS